MFMVSNNKLQLLRKHQPHYIFNSLDLLTTQNDRLLNRNLNAQAQSTVKIVDFKIKTHYPQQVKTIKT